MRPKWMREWEAPYKHQVMLDEAAWVVFTGMRKPLDRETSNALREAAIAKAWGLA